MSVCIRIEDENVTSKVKADPFSTTSHLKYLLAVEAGISLPCWGTACCGWDVVTHSFHLKCCFLMAAPHQPGETSSPSTFFPYGAVQKPPCALPWMCTENEFKSPRGFCTQIKGRARSLLWSWQQEPAPQSWAAWQCHGLASALCKCPNWECQVSSIQKSVLEAQYPAWTQHCPTPLLAQNWAVATARQFRGLLAVSTACGNTWEEF